MFKMSLGTHIHIRLPRFESWLCFPFQFLANKEAADDGSGSWFPATHMEAQNELAAPSFGLNKP